MGWIAEEDGVICQIFVLWIFKAAHVVRALVIESRGQFMRFAAYAIYSGE
jgi:hypothetical protein